MKRWWLLPISNDGGSYESKLAYGLFMHHFGSKMHYHPFHLIYVLQHVHEFNLRTHHNPILKLSHLIFLFNVAIITLGSWPKLKHVREIVKKMFKNSCTIPQVWENAKKMNPKHSQALWEFILGVENLIHLKS